MGARVPERGLSADADSVIKKGLALDPENSMMWVLAGRIAFHLGDLDRAWSDVSKAKTMNPFVMYLRDFKMVVAAHDARQQNLSTRATTAPAAPALPTSVLPTTAPPAIFPATSP